MNLLSEDKTSRSRWEGRTWGGRVKTHALGTLNSWKLGGGGGGSLPLSEWGHWCLTPWSCRTRCVRVLERAVSWSIIDKGAVLRAISLGIDWTIKCRGVNMGWLRRAWRGCVLDRINAGWSDEVVVVLPQLGSGRAGRCTRRCTARAVEVM